jgi:hypothetical protein
MKHFLYLVVLVVAFTGCKKSYTPGDHLSEKAQYELQWKIIRYLGRAPEGLTFEERFYKAYDSHYEEQMGLHRLDALFKQGDTYFFLISRRAPSIQDKRVSTGGRLKLDGDGKLMEYEEVFRTWKMPEVELAKKGMLLFDKMVKGESLEAYLTKNSWPEEYIEFPDDINYFDKASRRWLQRQKVQ